MRMVQTWPLILAMTLGNVTGAIQSAGAQTSDARNSITVHISNYALVGATDLIQAEQVAAAIFNKAGVSTRWLDANHVPEIESSTPDNQNLTRLSHIQVHIQLASMAGGRGFPENVMGCAPGSGPGRRLVYVFYDRVRDLAQRQVAAQVKGDTLARAGKSQILGEMIAHEIGHLLLDLPAHSKTGIMRGDWDLKDLQDVAHGDLIFTEEQSWIVRTEVVRRTNEVGQIVGNVHLD